MTPEHGGATAWRFCIALLVLAGLWKGLLNPESRGPLAPWILFGASKLLVCVFFFGYARQGVLILPIVTLACALALGHWVVPRLGKRGVRLGAGLVVLLLGGELLRYSQGVTVTIDGLPVQDVDPIPFDQHTERSLLID